ncbi:MAG: leucine-rich repeat protein [Bacteroidaceae bacterium]|nr:leucine-rich repeat protein [Bacteroidaceae bacterium]
MRRKLLLVLSLLVAIAVNAEQLTNTNLQADESVGVTYNVEVPAGTYECYIAGDMNSWSMQAMTKVDDTHYTIYMEEADLSQKYKYCSGPSWTYVEKDANGAEVENRSWSEYDVVARWNELYVPSTEPEVTVKPEGDIVVYLEKSTAYFAPYLYVWGGADLGVWPGMLMTETETVYGVEYWKHTFVAPEAAINIIFNDAAGNQTVDITDVVKTTYYRLDNLTGQTTVTELTPTEATSLTYNVEVPAGTPVCYIAGTFTSWNIELMTRVDDTHYTMTVENGDVNDEYKYLCGNAWEYVEVYADGSMKENRTWSEYDVVEAWNNTVMRSVTYTAYYSDTNWGDATVYAYSWDINFTEFLGAWPGTPMERTDDGSWKISFEAPEVVNDHMIVFNNGSGGGTNQTDDLPFINNGVYQYNGYVGSSQNLGIVGVYNAHATSGFADFPDEEWVVTISSDNRDANKVWIDPVCLIPNLSDETINPIYGIYNADAGTIEIPLGQVLYESENNRLVLALADMLNGATPITEGVCVAQVVVDGLSSTITISDMLGVGDIVTDQWWYQALYDITYSKTSNEVPEDIVITVTVDKPGTMGNEILKQEKDLSIINELIVIGSINENDMKLFPRMVGLKKLDLSQTDIATISYCNNLSALHTVLLPETVKTLDNEAFYECSSLIVVDMPGVEQIGDYAFYGCEQLRDIDLSRVKRVGEYAFYECTSLIGANLISAETLGYYSFSYCSQLQSVTFNDNLQVIPDGCFYNCPSLTTVDMPASLVTVEDSAFYYCAIREVILPAGVTTIGSSAFYRCPIVTLSLPSTLETIEDYAFYSNTLVTVYSRMVSPITTNAFYNVQSATLYVPALSLVAYMIHDSWSKFTQILPLEEELDLLDITADFTLTDLSYLADTIGLNLRNQAHLDIDADSVLHIGQLEQWVDVSEKKEHYNYETGMYEYDYLRMPTMIVNSDVKVENASTRLVVKTDEWNFISLPYDVNVADIIYPEGVLWVIRKYSGADRAALTGNTWHNMTDGMTLKAGEGYILHCNISGYSRVEFIFPSCNESVQNIVAKDDVVVPLHTYNSEFTHNRSWNLVGNPYPAFFDIAALEHNGIITVWEDWAYKAYSVLDDEYLLHPYESFFVQCPDDATSMTFGAEGRAHSYNTDNTNREYIARRHTPVATQREVYNFTLGRDGIFDKTRLVINEEAKMEYEIACDAGKFMSDNAPQQLYIINNGVRYAIDERPQEEGFVSLGMTFAEAGEYTLGLRTAVHTQEVLLIDNMTGKQVNLVDGDYTFTTSAGTFDSRFTIAVDGVLTSITNLERDLTNGDYTIYDLSGRKLSKVEHSGIYIVQKGEVSRKVFVTK